MTRTSRDYDDIPGTFVFDSGRSQQGYALNKFCMSLNEPTNREAFRADEEEYLRRFDLTSEQRTAVLERQWLRLLELGGNIFYTFKLAMFDGLSMQYVGGAMSGMTEEQFRKMMLDGGRRARG